jgi:hypothetical protein
VSKWCRGSKSGGCERSRGAGFFLLLAMLGLREAGICRITLGCIRSHGGGFSLGYFLPTRFTGWLDEGERVVAVPVAHGGRGLMRSRIVYRSVGAPECCSYLVCKQSVKRDGVWRWEKRVLILCAEEMTSQEPPTCPLVNNAEAQRGKEQEQHWLTWLDLSVKKPNIRHLEG